LTIEPYPSASGASSDPSPLRVLVVDDEDSLRETTRLMLSRAGYAVTTASSAADAAAHISERATLSFDLVLTDLHMPGGSGLDVLRTARDHDPSTQVVSDDRVRLRGQRRRGHEVWRVRLHREALQASAAAPRS
jgi:PleD family two-component response regulator